jgi:hypothetical protein
MRSVLSISVPPKKLAALKKRAKSQGMTISAYVLRFVDEEERMISEEELLEDIRVGEKEYRDGKCKVLRTDADFNQFFRNAR